MNSVQYRISACLLRCLWIGLRIGSFCNSQAFVPRPIKHPLFKNMTGQQAVTALETKDDFEFIFRPSPRVRA